MTTPAPPRRSVGRTWSGERQRHGTTHSPIDRSPSAPRSRGVTTTESGPTTTRHHRAHALHRHQAWERRDVGRSRAATMRWIRSGAASRSIPMARRSCARRRSGSWRSSARRSRGAAGARWPCRADPRRDRSTRCSRPQRSRHGSTGLASTCSGATSGVCRPTIQTPTTAWCVRRSWIAWRFPRRTCIASRGNAIRTTPLPARERSTPSERSFRVTHYGEALTVTDTSPIARSLPPIAPREAPEQPPGRAPVRRSAR